MDKNKVYELFYNLIRDSMDWAEDTDHYCRYVDGAVDMVFRMLENLDDKEVGKEN